jgi:TonB family protein
MQSAVAKAQAAEAALPRPVEAPVFLVPWESAPRIFLHNLGDLFRREPLLLVTSRPARFWPDVFVDGPLPRKGFALSAVYHAGFFAFLYLVPFFAQLSQQPAITPPAHTTLTYYNVSEYLPPVNARQKPVVAKTRRQPDPAYAPQPIISVAQSLDNVEQTIVEPNAVRLNQNVRLPNLVVSTPVPALPAAALERSTAKLILPTLAPEVIQPAPTTTSRAISQLALPAMPQPAIIEPAPLPDAMQRKLGDINIAHVDPQIQEPKLIVMEQRAATSNPENIPNARQEDIVPPLSAASSAGSGEKAVGQVLVLGLNPALPHGPITLAGGNRRGEFAATPEGRVGGSGAPPAGDASARDHQEIHIGGKSAQNGSGVVVAKPAPDPAKQRMFASLASPGITELARQTRPGAVANPDPIEDEVFAGKRFYSLVLNMPNLTSASGSWVVRFAELHPSAVRGDLTAPVATGKVDPAYPAELMRNGVEGTVVLYAVIRSDGSVGEVRVLRGFDARLDENARIALSRWHFRPATKNGAAVDLEAVVQIPFRVERIF